jgi:ribonuclease HI
MFFFNPRIISASSGSYGDNADNNVAELKAIMKNLIIHDRPQKTQAAVWATDLDKSVRKVDASTQTEGGRMWAYQPKKKTKKSQDFCSLSYTTSHQLVSISTMDFEFFYR